MSISHIGLAFLTFQASLQTIIICVIGFLAARYGYLPKAMQKYMSQLNILIFTPSLIFVKLASQLSFSVLKELSVIPLLFAFSTLVTFLASRFISHLFRFNHREANFVTAMGVFGNTSSLPVSLLQAMAHTLPILTWDGIEGDNGDKIFSRGILYIVIYQQLSLVFKWSWGYNKLLAKETKEVEELSREDPESMLRRSGSSAVTINETDPLLPGSKPTPYSAGTIPYSLSSATLSSLEPEPPKQHPVIRFWTWVLDMMNPPLWAVAGSVAVAFIPPLKYQIFVNDGFINKTLTAALQQISRAAVPLILVVLGATLNPESTDDAEDSKQYKQLIIASLMSRIFLPSVIILPCVALAAKYMSGVFPIVQDPVFLLIAFILTVTPPAIQLSQICQINRVFELEMAGVLFWGYAVAVLPMIVLVVLLASQTIAWIK